MIISASRRTDIPAYFSDWFYNRIEKGFVLVRNPMNIHQVSNINISPDVVDCIVFWTRNPRKFIERLEMLEKYQFYFQYTITGYGRQLEPNVPSLEESISCFQTLSKLIGAHRVIWRYDPIIITGERNLEYHINHFNSIAEKLSGYTRKCVISFVDYYKKTVKNLKNINYKELTSDEIIKLSTQLSNLGRKYNIALASCSEAIDLERFGIVHGKCIDDKLIEEITGVTFDIDKDKSQRKECGCIASIDIGAYNTCSNGCLYCYANYDLNSVRLNYAEHDSNSDLIYGKLSEHDKINIRKVLSCKVISSQRKLDF